MTHGRYNQLILKSLARPIGWRPAANHKKETNISSCSYGECTGYVRKTLLNKQDFRLIDNGEITLKSITSSLASAGLSAVLLLSLVGCSDSGQEPVTGNPALTAPVPDGMVRGKVAETMNSAGYTYVLIESGENQYWAAAPEQDVEVGDVVQTVLGMAMREFTSKTLNRSFDVVYFVGAVENLSNPTLPAENPGTGYAGEEERLDVEVAELEPGQNIAWVYANKDNLAGQQISLRGKVTKFNANILGTNFIHIQDGSGDAANGSNDLTVTSKAVTAVNDEVRITGTIILNKDFGYGYKFAVLMEDASITSE